MSPEVRDALQAGADVGDPRRRRAIGTVRAIVYAVVLELPTEMTLSELCDELCIGNNQDRDR